MLFLLQVFSFVVLIVSFSQKSDWLFWLCLLIFSVLSFVLVLFSVSRLKSSLLSLDLVMLLGYSLWC